jgi:hypothetical protein
LASIRAYIYLKREDITKYELPNNTQDIFNKLGVLFKAIDSSGLTSLQKEDKKTLQEEDEKLSQKGDEEALPEEGKNISPEENKKTLQEKDKKTSQKGGGEMLQEEDKKIIEQIKNQFYLKSIRTSFLEMQRAADKNPQVKKAFKLGDLYSFLREKDGAQAEVNRMDKLLNIIKYAKLENQVKRWFLEDLIFTIYNKTIDYSPLILLPKERDVLIRAGIDHKNPFHTKDPEINEKILAFYRFLFANKKKIYNEGVIRQEKEEIEKKENDKGVLPRTFEDLFKCLLEEIEWIDLLIDIYLFFKEEGSYKVESKPIVSKLKQYNRYMTENNYKIKSLFLSLTNMPREKLLPFLTLMLKDIGDQTSRDKFVHWAKHNLNINLV